MPVLDALGRDPAVSHIMLVEPDEYKPHNVERHVFPASAVGRLKVELAAEWLRERRPDVEVRTFACDLLDAKMQDDLAAAAASCDIGVCAADNEPADDPGFTTLLIALRRVAGVFDEPFRPIRIRIARSADCLICRDHPPAAGESPEDLDVALDSALARLGQE